MLPGVELARRRRVHYHGDAASSAAASAAEHHYHYAHAHRHAGPAAAVTGPAMAARIRLEEKLRGAALPSATSPSRSVALPPIVICSPGPLLPLPCFSRSRLLGSQNHAIGRTRAKAKKEEKKKEFSS